jgi:predicted transcriptional regulator
MEAGEFDEELLETAVQRRGAFRTLRNGPHHRRELQRTLDISKTTCHRIVRTFDEEGLINRTADGYVLTELGHIVAREVLEFEEAVETAFLMEPLLELFEADDTQFDRSLITDERVDWAVDRDSAQGLDRGMERVREADTLRVMDWTPVPELYIERIFEIIAEEGIRAESIYPASRVRSRFEKFPDLHAELRDSDSENKYWIHDGVPTWGMSIYDDALVELRAVEPDTGAPIIEASSQDPPAVEWALSVWEAYREKADPLADRDELPDWTDV